MTALTIRLGDRTVTARVDSDGRVIVDNATFAVSPAGRAEYVVDDGRRRWRVAVADAGETRWVSVDGQVAAVEIESGSGRAP